MVAYADKLIHNSMKLHKKGELLSLIYIRVQKQIRRINILGNSNFRPYSDNIFVVTVFFYTDGSSVEINVIKTISISCVEK